MADKKSSSKKSGASSAGKIKRLKEIHAEDMKKLRAKGKGNEAKATMRAYGGGVAGAGLVGVGRRLIDNFGSPESFGSGLPHIQQIGEAGTYGAGMVLVGAIAGQKDLVAAGMGAVNAQVYLSAAGVQTVSDIARVSPERKAEILKARDESLKKKKAVPTIMDSTTAASMDPDSRPAAIRPNAQVAYDIPDAGTSEYDLTELNLDNFDAEMQREMDEVLAEMAGAETDLRRG